MEIYSIEQRRINVVHFNVDMKNVRQLRNNTAITNVKFQSVGQRRTNVVNITIGKILKKNLDRQK